MGLRLKGILVGNIFPVHTYDIGILLEFSVLLERDDSEGPNCIKTKDVQPC